MNAHEVLYYLAKTGGPYPVQALSYVTISAADYVEYAGVAARGSATSAAVWRIWKLTYTGKNVTLIQTSLENQIWDNRAAGVTYA